MTLREFESPEEFLDWLDMVPLSEDDDKTALSDSVDCKNGSSLR